MVVKAGDIEPQYLKVFVLKPLDSVIKEIDERSPAFEIWTKDALSPRWGIAVHDRHVDLIGEAQ
jgi:hypothetical protein